MPQKMLSCICGNTDLESVGVNLLRSNDAESLELVALLCRGNGCGRVTFRPPEVRSADTQANDMTKAKPNSNHDGDTMKRLIALFEQVYTERLVYKAIAERDPGCNVLVDALKADRGIRERIARTFTPIYEGLERSQDVVKLLESLPSTGSNPANGTVAAVGAHE